MLSLDLFLKDEINGICGTFLGQASRTLIRSLNHLEEYQRRCVSVFLISAFLGIARVHKVDTPKPGPMVF